MHYFCLCLILSLFWIILRLIFGQIIFLRHWLSNLNFNLPEDKTRIITSIAHWSENTVLGQQFVFSRLLADFDAQYGKLGVLGARESIYEKKNIWPRRSKSFKMTFKVWFLPFPRIYWTFGGLGGVQSKRLWNTFL